MSWNAAHRALGEDYGKGGVTPTLGVITPGLRTTVQDLGRGGYQSFGIGVSGALDPISLRAANALVGNPPSAGTLEVAYVGPTLAVEAEEVRFAFVGAVAPIEVLPEVTAVSGRRIAPLRSVRLRRGEVVRVGSLSDGAVLYIAVEGGFDIAPVLQPIRAGASGAGRAARSWQRTGCRSVICDRATGMICGSMTSIALCRGGSASSSGRSTTTFPIPRSLHFLTASTPSRRIPIASAYG